MDREAFFEGVRAQGEFSAEDAEKIVSAVTSALGERLTPDEAGALAAHVPGAVAQWLRPAPRPAAPDVDSLYARVAELTGLPAVRALEASQVVCRALGAAVGPDVRARLEAHLGPDLGRLFEPPDAGAPPERPPRLSDAPAPGEGHTLATGRPGSRHPLSEARPETAHADSVARSDAPHADSKLSSARGLTQEALHETLAEGKPPAPRRTVADTRD